MSSSQANEIGTGFQSSEPILCANGCGFFGAAATNGLCSKCYRDSCIEEERAASARAAVHEFIAHRGDGSPDVRAEKPAEEAETSAVVEKKSAAVRNRCLSCNRKVGVVGFQCRCGSTFCCKHRHPEDHCCTFDFKGEGKNAIAKANPVVKADKIDRF